MSATTITRDTLTNDTGTAASPNGDGTILNNAFLQNNIYARIDALFALTTFTFGGKITAEGFGTHSFSAGGTGSHAIFIRNTAAGTGNRAQVILGNDASSGAGVLSTFSSTYTTASQYRANSVLLEGVLAGGLSLSATHGSGAIRFFTVNTERAVIDEGGRLGYGGAATGTAQIRVTGSFTPAGGATSRGILYDGTLAGQVNQSVYALEINPSILEAGSGTHPVFASLGVGAPSVSANAAALTTAAALYVFASPTGATNNYALYVAAGTSRFGGNMILDSTFLFMIGDTANSSMTTGITINQGSASDEIFAVKSSVPHNFTSVTEADTYFLIRKADASLGGARIAAFMGSPGIGGALELLGASELAPSAKSTSANGAVNIDGAIHSGGGLASMGSDGNIISFRDNGTTRHILDSDGDSHQDVGTAWTNFDTEEDIAVLNLLSAHVTRANDPLRQSFHTWLDQSRVPLERLGLVSFNEDGHHFVNMSRLSMLLTGAVRQLATRCQTLEQRLLTLEA